MEEGKSMTSTIQNESQQEKMIATEEQGGLGVAEGGEVAKGSASASASSSKHKEKQKVVVVMGASGTGKSRLAVDLAQHFSAEIINADSMQVYQGLDILTNKITEEEKKGIPHHLLGTIESSASFTSKDFRDKAIPIIESIISQNRLPIIVGGTNYYIQALLTSFLFEDLMEERYCNMQIRRSSDSTAGHRLQEINWKENINNLQEVPNNDNQDANKQFEELKQIDPVSANRLHPNDTRKIKRYLEIFKTTGMLPSKLFRGDKSKTWGRADTCRYDCCFLCVDAALPVLDSFVKKRVDKMIKVGLLEEVSRFYEHTSTYANGLKQAIGVKEFEEFFKAFPPDKFPAEMEEMTLSEKKNHKNLLHSAISNMKANTCKLIRRQKRRIHKLKSDFGWQIHELDVTRALETPGAESDQEWEQTVVRTSVSIVKSFLAGELQSINENITTSTTPDVKRDLWTQYICEACGDRVLRGAHEWEQHKRGRSHRRQMMRLKKKFNETRNLQD
eukprot:TRINITY_DN1370_c0_g1_i3.p1 TRINITY_DN1370_c0_g1~~TRINITY_DN1370_c0_g1_i3.p1  ORF type:complete len:503 (+),score=120.36 TRINITY_DN1370_c0_g1_i3:494-2002(+)